MPSARHEAEVNVTAEQLMAVITDFDSYSQFLPEMESCDVVSSGDNQWDVRFTVKVVKRIRYTLRLQRVDDHHVRWTLVDGAFKVNNGGWDLVPSADGSSVHVVYFIELQVGMFVPSSIMRTVVERTLPDTVMRFKQEAERRAATS